VADGGRVSTGTFTAGTAAARMAAGAASEWARRSGLASYYGVCFLLLQTARHRQRLDSCCEKPQAFDCLVYRQLVFVTDRAPASCLRNNIFLPSCAAPKVTNSVIALLNQGSLAAGILLCPKCI
jgi:hypothetical protein